MKKKIILALSALVLFSQAFANCLQTVFEMERMEINMFDENLRNGEWTYQTTVIPHDSIKVTHEGNVWNISGTIDDMKKRQPSTMMVTP